MDTVNNAIITFAQTHAWLSTILAIMIVCRGLFKPIQSAIGAYVKSTPSTKDDEFIDKIEHSKIYVVLHWIVDLIFSIKIEEIKAAVDKAKNS